MNEEGKQLTLTEIYGKCQQWTSSFDINILLISSKGKMKQNHNIMGCVTNFCGDVLEENRLNYFVKF